MIPPCIRRSMVRAGVVIAASAAMTLAAIPAQRWFPGSAVLEYLPLWGLLPGVAASVWFGSVTRGAYRRWKASPHGLCVGCEYPLPAPGAEGPEGLVKCPECGLERRRGTQRGEWTQWFGMMG